VYEDEFTVTTRTDAEAAVVIASGEIDLSTCALLRSQLCRTIEDTTADLVVLDASNIMFISSGGLAVLVTAAHLAEQHHKRFRVLTGDRRVIPRALHIAGLDRVVTTCPTYADVFSAEPQPTAAAHLAGASRS
jgi:anti-sigma B factor antagonist